MSHNIQQIALPSNSTSRDKSSTEKTTIMSTTAESESQYRLQASSPNGIKATLEQTVAQNNHSVVLIENGDYSQAAALLRASLRTIKALLLQSTSGNDRRDDITCPGALYDDHPVHDDAVVSCVPSPLQLEEEPSMVMIVGGGDANECYDDQGGDAMDEDDKEMDTPLPRTSSDTLQLYQRPLKLDPHQVCRLDEQQQPDAIALLASGAAGIIVFNMALAMQLSTLSPHNKQAEEDGDFSDDEMSSSYKKKSKLQKVKHLYELALELLASTPSDSDLPVMAAVNNLGVLHHVQLESYQDASKYFQYLMMILMYRYVFDHRQGQGSSSSPSALSEEQEQLEFLLQNALLALFYSTEHLPCAPAA